MANSSMGIGIMAAFAVSGSVVLIARQFHKRLISDFMKKVEFEFKGSRKSCIENKRRVRISEKSRIKEEERAILKMENYINKKKFSNGGDLLEAMPENRRVLYLGILKYRSQLLSA